jgi:hypothetical protein
MLDLFQGFGVQSFSLTVTDDTGRKVAFRRNSSIELLRSELPCFLFASCGKRLNVIVRPITPLNVDVPTTLAYRVPSGNNLDEMRRTYAIVLK